MAYLEPQLQELPPDPLALPGDFFRKLVRRIEYIKPVQKKKDPVITVTPLPGGGGHEIDIKNTTWKTITICEDGTPKTYDFLVRSKS